MKTVTLLRIALCVTCGFSALAVTASGSPKLSSPRSNVALPTVVRDAQAVVGERADMQVVRVQGDSMQPFFSHGAVLIVKQIPVAKLRAGMVVVYTNRFGERVAHRIVSPDDTGWRVQGYANAEADSTVVSGDNLIGVVYGTLHSDASSDVSLNADAIGEGSIVLAAAAR